jgi:cell wall-associated NlpC family hydrolase
MPTLSATSIAQYAFTVGFRGESVVTITAICGAESGFQYGSETDTGTVSGPAQINYSAHPQYDRDKLTNDPSYNLRAAYTISNGGNNFGAWDTYDSPPAPKDPGNGRYRQFLRVARIAAAKVDTTITAAPLPQGKGSTPYRGFLPPDNEKAIDLTIAGKQARSALGYSLVAADVQFTNTEASQLSLTFDDNDFLILQRYQFTVGPTGTPIEYADQRWRIQSLATQPTDKGPQTVMVCQPSGVMRMKGLTPNPGKRISPTDYMAGIAQEAGLDFVGEPTATRQDIGPKKIPDPSTGQKRYENAWEIGQRLAANHDLVAYESRGTYYFATPAFIAKQAKLWYVFIGKLDADYDALTDAQKDSATIHVVEAIGWPSIGTKAQGVGVKSQRTLSCQIRRGQGKQLRAGDRLLIGVVPQLSGGPPLAVTSVQWDPTDIAAGPVSIEAADLTSWASQSTDQGDATAKDGGQTSGRGIAKKGTASALDFVTFALAQRHDHYQYGATPSPTDPNPDAEDCSSLVQWSAAQTGVTMPRTSGEQWQFCKSLEISVEKALNTRGALLFIDSSDGTPGGEHVAISLGNGRQDMAAHTSHAPLNKQVAVWTTTVSEWDRAALIPGMSYGSGGVVIPGGTDRHAGTPF